MNYKLHLGDCREVMATLEDNSVDSIVCDPPYELNFMGRTWDNSGVAYDVTVWRQCLRVLKPGGHLIAFGGSRTYHRLAVAIEDAGFEIRDQIQWIYGSGFPKSLDVSKAMDKQAGAEHLRQDAGPNPAYRPSAYVWNQGGGETPMRPERKTAPATDLAKQWQGWGTALKPAHEPAVLARKPLCGTVADNVTAWGVGALNIDGTRVEADDAHWTHHGTADSGMWSGKKRIYQENTISGRWPANVILDEEAALLLGEPSRFFYTSKASKAEREAGLYGMEQRQVAGKGNGLARTCEMCGANTLNGCECENRTYINPTRLNHHPTVKPLSLMRYLVRLVTPKGGIVLDPFMGSGSTGCASALERFDFIGIDITDEYVNIAKKRIMYYSAETPLEGV